MLDVYRACERSRKLSDAGKKSGGSERSLERAWQKTMEWEWSGEQAESATHSNLTFHSTDFITYIVRIALSAV